MQVTGDQFTAPRTRPKRSRDFPDFPAEIRAPPAPRYGVSGFQIHFSSQDVFTPGDAPDVLVAMNPPR
jgi:2-oxoglutarate ferredoxin oxidoreductase subunit alpha